MSNIPLDIWMDICDIVADTNDDTTMEACALIRPDLTAHCQKHLFSNVTVAFRQGSSASNLCQVLEENPWLISCIQALDFKFNKKEQFYLPTVPLLLSKCKNVPSFSIRFQTNQDWTPSFQSLVLGTQNAVMRFLASPTLTNVCIDGFHLPIAFIFPHIQSNLKHLEATGGSALTSGTSSTWQVPSSTRSEPISLISLKANSSMVGAVLDAKFGIDSTQSLFDFTHLETLTAFVSNNVGPVTALLRRTAQLNTFRLNLSGQSVTIEGLLDFPVPFCSSLRHVEFILAIVQPDDEMRSDIFYNSEAGLPGPVDDNMLPRLIQELSRLPPDNVIESIQFRIRYLIREQLSPRTICEDNWRALKALGNGTLPFLKDVQIHVTVEDWHGCPENDWIIDRIAAVLAEDSDQGFCLTSSFEYNWKWE